MFTKEECYIALNDMYDSTLLSKDDCEDNREILAQLIEEHFKLVEENRKLKIALDNAIKECCINADESDACSSLDELYKSFEKKVWENVD